MKLNRIDQSVLERIAKYWYAGGIDTSNPYVNPPPAPYQDTELKCKENPLPPDHPLYNDVEQYLRWDDPIPSSEDTLNPGDLYRQMLQRQIGRAKLAQYQ